MRDERYRRGVANEMRTARVIGMTPPSGDVGVNWRPSRVNAI